MAPVHDVLNAQEERAWRAFRLMNAEITARIRRELGRETGLSDPDYEVLHELWEEPDGALRAMTLRTRLHWEKSRLSHHIVRMQRRGLVTREHSLEDARGATIRLTQSGRAAVEAACRAHARAVRSYLLDRLSPEQLAALGDISETVLAGLGAEEPAR